MLDRKAWLWFWYYERASEHKSQMRKSNACVPSGHVEAALATRSKPPTNFSLRGRS